MKFSPDGEFFATAGKVICERAIAELYIWFLPENSKALTSFFLLFI